MSVQILDASPIENAEEIKQKVKSYYGKRAQQATSSCCGTDCCASDSEAEKLYNNSELSQIPDEAANASLGCGNPTAIASLKAGEIVLDLGSGGGIDVFLAARQVGDTGFVYGVDMTDEMLALARKNAAKMGVANVEFRQGHIEDIPLPEKSVDVIISNCVINLAPDKGQVLQDAFRVLKSGGRLAVSDIVIDGTLGDLPVSEGFVRQALSWAGCIAGALTIEQYETLLQEAGFTDIQVDIKHRYSLQELGQDMGEIAGKLAPDVVHKLVNRFTSASIAATRPL